jgi:hypothetical protein
MKLNLKGDDAAVVFRSDGEIEAYFPHEDGGMGPDSNAPPGVVAAGLCLVMLSDTAFGASIRAMVEAHMRATIYEGGEDEDQNQ